MDPDKEEKGPMAALPENGADYGQARLRQPGGASPRSAQGDGDGAYRAALKKLDLLADRPQAVLRELVKQDAAGSPPEGMAPW
jgi:hypothetical protein